MSGLSGISADRRNKAIAVAVFVLIAVGILYYDLAGGTSDQAVNAPVASPTAATVNTSTANDAAAPAENVSARPAAAGNAPRRVTAGSAALDPALHMDAMLASEQVEYSGAGRNIFSPNSAPPVIPRPIAPARPAQTVIAPPVRTGPPPPPPIDLTFFGTETDSTGRRQAILLHQDTVYTAQAGDIVLRRYRVISVDAKSIQVEDMVTNNRQTLPLVAN